MTREPGIFDAITEAIEVGREARLPVQISHFKVVGKRIWGESSRAVAVIESGRAAEKPHAFSAGFRWVIVKRPLVDNGLAVEEARRLTLSRKSVFHPEGVA